MKVSVTIKWSLVSLESTGGYEVQGRFFWWSHSNVPGQVGTPGSPRKSSARQWYAFWNEKEESPIKEEGSVTSKEPPGNFAKLLLATCPPTIRLRSHIVNGHKN